MWMDAGHLCAGGLSPEHMNMYRRHMNKGLLVTHWPYGTTTEVHGLTDKAMHLYIGTADDPLIIVRGGIFGAWASEYGFTATQLGAIGGAGFSGFCFGIIIGGVIVDKIGYGKLIAVALLGSVPPVSAQPSWWGKPQLPPDPSDPLSTTTTYTDVTWFDTGSIGDMVTPSASISS